MLLLTFSLLYLYFTINEYLTSVYKVEGPERLLLHQLFFGDYEVLMWVTQALFIAIPLVMIAAVLTVKRIRQFTPSVVALASVLIVIGAGAKRYLIVVPTLTAPYLANTNTISRSIRSSRSIGSTTGPPGWNGPSPLEARLLSCSCTCCSPKCFR